MPLPAAWLSGFADAVALSVEPLNSEPLSALSCHFTRYDGVWEITLFRESTEVIGGPEDGSIKPCPFGVRIADVLDLFQSISSCNWQANANGPEDDLGPHLSVEGIYKGRSVWLRILASAPRQFPRRRRIVRNRLINDDAW
jgi:hypothetical protein